MVNLVLLLYNNPTDYIKKRELGGGGMEVCWISS
uniref:Uncharacterized protein n=1 Tax=Rhizophora mucronata TaxID=61149 RepID=A0A2P2N0M7_RHIMU